MEKQYITQLYLTLTRILTIECQKKILGIGEKVKRKKKEREDISTVLQY